MAVLEDSAQPQHTCSFLWRRNTKCRNKWGRAVFRELITSGELKKGNFQQGNKAVGWLFPPFCHLSEIAVNKEGNFLALFIFWVSFISQVCSIALETSLLLFFERDICIYKYHTIKFTSLFPLKLEPPPLSAHLWSPGPGGVLAASAVWRSTGVAMFFPGTQLLCSLSRNSADNPTQWLWVIFISTLLCRASNCWGCSPGSKSSSPPQTPGGSGSREAADQRSKLGRDTPECLWLKLFHSNHYKYGSAFPEHFSFSISFSTF